MILDKTSCPDLEKINSIQVEVYPELFKLEEVQEIQTDREKEFYRVLSFGK